MLLSAFSVCASAAAPKLSKTKATVIVAKSLTLKVKNYSKTVKWATSNKNIAKVSSKGVVKGITTGKATITATAGSKKLTCKVTVRGCNIPSDAKKYNGHYYKLYESASTWKKAKSLCESLGGHLVTITSEGEQNFVYNNIAGNRYAWIGATDEAKEGSWKWITGETWSYTHWASGQPDNYNGNEDYACFWGNANWNDFAVSDTCEFYVCEWDGTGKTGLNKTSASVFYGATTALKVNHTAAKVKWSSANAKIASVTSKGVVKGVAPGKTTITAKTAGKTFKCKVTVVDRNQAATASLKCTTGGTFIKGVNTATASFKLKSFKSAKVTAAIVNSSGTEVFKQTFTNVAKNTLKSFVWSGKNKSGDYVPAGSYRLKVTAGSQASYSAYLPFKAVNEFAAGDGSKGNPYQIKTTAQFGKIGRYPNACFKQTANLDFGHNSAGGFFSDGQPFKGVYDGNNLTIKNINASNAVFNYTAESAVLKNIVIKDCVIISSDWHTAMLVLFNSGKIQNCTVTANIAVTKNDNEDASAAILVCDNYGNISGCKVYGEVSINNSYLHRAAYAGGVCSYNEGKVISTYANCKVSAFSWANHWARGFASSFVRDNRGLVIDCESSGTTSVSYDKRESPTYAQFVDYNTGTVQNCVYTGTQQITFVRDNTGVII